MTIQRLPAGPRYSQAVIHSDIVYLAGVVAHSLDADMATQAVEVFAEIDRVLVSAGTDKARLLTLQCFIANFSDFDSFNHAYDAWIDPAALPTRATVAARMFDPRVRIEIVATAGL